MAARGWREALVVLAGGAVVIAASQVSSTGRTGTDEAARDAVIGARPDYAPWAEPVRHNTPQQEQGLFVLQGAIGVATLAMAVWALRRGRGSDASQ